ncbi:MAG TPA: hypothetical protein VH351_04380 [Bryobacteraceae bacterium]|jgi:hypothetical protein|nr:hypothetical protein [Bryobacteraceae bacterium]
MQQVIYTAVFVTDLLVSRGTASPQNTTTEPRNALTIEVLELRADVLQFLLGTEQVTIQMLRRDLDRLQRDAQRIEDDEAARERQLADIEQQLSSPDLEADARPEVEAIRQQLSTEAARKLRSERENLQVRKADVMAKLNLELQREQALQRRAALIQRALSR